MASKEVGAAPNSATMNFQPTYISDVSTPSTSHWRYIPFVQFYHLFSNSLAYINIEYELFVFKILLPSPTLFSSSSLSSLSFIIIISLPATLLISLSRRVGFRAPYIDMPESMDYQSQIASPERKLRSLRRNILGTAAAGASAVSNADETLLFEARLKIVLADWEKFQTMRDDLESAYASIKSDFPTQPWLDFYDTLRLEIVTAEAHMIKIQRDKHHSLSPPASQSLNMSLNATARSHLPQIPLPSFSGNLLEWTHFRDTFVSMVHNEPTLTNVEKFHYLLGAVRGEAASLISRLTVEENTYSQAWKKLNENYDNPRVLASLFIQEILECDCKTAKSELQR